MSWYEIYLNNVAQTPKESWKSTLQESIKSSWEDTTQLRTIKEQSYPFSDNYTEYECWVDTVSDISVNTNKSINNFISVLFKDCDHILNHRGQKYLYKLDGVNESTFLCYDRMNELSQTADTKLIMCNNRIKAIDKSTGEIWEEPVYVGFDFSSTNEQINKKGTISNGRLVCMAQYNNNTKKIKTNQRFILSHKTAFSVEQLNLFNLENTNDSEPTMLMMDIKWSTVIPTDDLVNNLASVGVDEYTIDIVQDNIEQVKGYKGQLSALVKLNGQTITDKTVVWKSSNPTSISIDKNGNYELLGDVGTNSIITCELSDNADISDSISIKIVSNYLGEKIIRVSPIVSELIQGQIQDFACGVYINETKQSDIVKCTPNFVDNNIYVLTETIDGYKVEVLKSSNTNLILTFSSGSITPIIMNISLAGLF